MLVIYDVNIKRDCVKGVCVKGCTVFVTSVSLKLLLSK